MRVVDEEDYPSTPGKVKVERSGARPLLRQQHVPLLRGLLGRPPLGAPDPRLRLAAPPAGFRRGRRALRAGDRRGRVRGHALLPRPPQARRRRGRPRQLQLLLRPVAEEGPARAARLARRVRRGGRHQRRPPPREALRRGPVHARAPPGRAGGRALRHGEPGVVRALQRRGARLAPRGVQGRRPATGHRVGVLVVRVRAQRPRAILGGAPHRPAGVALRGDEEGRGGDHTTYNHIYGLSVTGLRFFTVYGPWGRPDMAYFSFTRNILQGKPITVYRGRDHVDLARDFTYIDDIVRGCLASLDTAGRSTGIGGKKRGPAPYRIYNLGNTSPVTVPRLVSILETYLRVKAKKSVIEMPGNGDVPFTHANISLAREQLGYKPTTSLEMGLKKFVRWYLSYYGYNRGTRGFKNL
ncbi:hypothetical protein PR202_gb17664 [Eleusine coracana subsp. coracana]|uniref:NAD-dependent epimerase/dehydratase domain-containing protein n=1 Tax=Eleusine coracana subsp. coracana TaxID=191504 RepID=A0AAV5F463_ELECO|nr:hypothetical protein PR202_gb17664 [Eleusine coracana subsp. coracana]